MAAQVKRPTPEEYRLTEGWIAWLDEIDRVIDSPSFRALRAELKSIELKKAEKRES